MNVYVIDELLFSTLGASIGDHTCPGAEEGRRAPKELGRPGLPCKQLDTIQLSLAALKVFKSIPIHEHSYAGAWDMLRHIPFWGPCFPATFFHQKQPGFGRPVQLPGRFGDLAKTVKARMRHALRPDSFLRPVPVPTRAC